MSKDSKIFPVLISEHLTLRQPLESDASELFLIRSDSRINKYLDRKPTETVAEALNFIKKVNENFKNNLGFYWVITLSDKLIGTICLFNFSDELKKCEVGYELLPEHQGQGLMNEALKKVIEFTFKTLRLKTIEAFTHKDNQSSTKLLQKFHFEKMMAIDQANPNLIAFRLSN